MPLFAPYRVDKLASAQGTVAAPATAATPVAAAAVAAPEEKPLLPVHALCLSNYPRAHSARFGSRRHCHSARQESLSLRELRSRLLGYGLSTLGLKNELRKRLENAMLHNRAQHSSWDPQTMTWV